MKRFVPILLMAMIASTRAMGAGGRVDSLLPVGTRLNLQRQDQAAVAELLDIESHYRQGRDHRKALVQLLPMARVGLFTRKVRVRLFGDLAKVSARLRLYPLAMRCYYNAWRGDTELPADSGYYRETAVQESVPESLDSVAGAFADGKEVAFYALLLEVKQPVPGRRKAFAHFSNVGHTFITLIKYNRDGSIVSRSFGFYPHKKGMLSATPLHPTAQGVIKDDSRHEWDEAAGKLLSYQQFTEVLTVLRSYDHRRYNLNHSNCTDFGLDIARVGGITVRNAGGSWPLGHGNNPGSAGQSLLEGKVADGSEHPSEGLLVIDNLGLKQ